MKKIKVLIVDDSSFIRQMFETLLASDPEIEVLDSAKDPYDAREKIKTLNPDVITLDIEMPKMDGISFLEKIMTLRPMPVVMVSSLTQKGADITLKALEMGAVDYIGKPVENQNNETISTLREELITKVKAAAKAKVDNLIPNRKKTSEHEELTIPKGKILKRKLIAIGSSTGGVEALKEVLTLIPEASPPILIVQHMPERFTKSFAQRLNGICKIKVHEAEDGQSILPGNAYISPGGRHLRIKKQASGYVCGVQIGEKVSGHCPSVDVLFDSVADVCGNSTIGVILTGMGSDGAKSMLRMRKSGAINIGQNEATCVVYGMPKEAKLNGAVEIEAPLNGIAKEIIKQCFN